MKNVRKITFEIVDKKDYEIPIDKNLVETYEFDTNGPLSRFYFTNISKNNRETDYGNNSQKEKKDIRPIPNPRMNICMTQQVLLIITTMVNWS